MVQHPAQSSSSHCDKWEEQNRRVALKSPFHWSYSDVQSCWRHEVVTWVLVRFACWMGLRPISQRLLEVCWSDLELCYARLDKIHRRNRLEFLEHRRKGSRWRLLCLLGRCHPSLIYDFLPFREVHWSSSRDLCFYWWILVSSFLVWFRAYVVLFEGGSKKSLIRLCNQGLIELITWSIGPSNSLKISSKKTWKLVVNNFECAFSKRCGADSIETIFEENLSLTDLTSGWSQIIYDLWIYFFDKTNKMNLHNDKWEWMSYLLFLKKIALRSYLLSVKLKYFLFTKL